MHGVSAHDFLSLPSLPPPQLLPRRRPARRVQRFLPRRPVPHHRAGVRARGGQGPVLVDGAGECRLRGKGQKKGGEEGEGRRLARASCERRRRGPRRRQPPWLTRLNSLVRAMEHRVGWVSPKWIGGRAAGARAACRRQRPFYYALLSFALRKASRRPRPARMPPHHTPFGSTSNGITIHGQCAWLIQCWTGLCVPFFRGRESRRVATAHKTMARFWFSSSFITLTPLPISSALHPPGLLWSGRLPHWRHRLCRLRPDRTAAAPGAGPGVHFRARPPQERRER